MSRLLAAVKSATARRRTAEHAYRAALEAAHQAGHTYQEIGDAAGITRRGAHYLIAGDPRKRGTDDA